MKKIFYLFLFLFFLQSVSGQINIGEVTDSTVLEYNLCLIIPEYKDSVVILQCKDSNGTTIYMEIRKDLFEGKININITPTKEFGPITKERTLNWFIIPGKEME